MSLFLETIKLENGEISALWRHQKRVDRVFAELYPGRTPLNLQNLLKDRELPGSGLYRLRIVYDEKGAEVMAAAYVRRTITLLRCVYDESASYPHKYADRSFFEKYAFADAEPLFIVNGWVTDTGFSNVAFFDGKKWLTPRTFLLRGTRRDFYLESGAVSEADISFMDIRRFEKISLINAMCGLGELELSTENIEI